METRISLSVTIPEDAIYGKAVLYVGLWQDNVLLHASKPYEDVAVCQPAGVLTPIYPYAVAAIRDAADRAIAAMLEHIAKGEVLLMHESCLQKM